jgi:cyclic lactone autoinducer peptide
MDMRGGVKDMNKLLLTLKKISNKAAEISGRKCWISFIYQPKCPSSLIQKD